MKYTEAGKSWDGCSNLCPKTVLLLWEIKKHP